MSLRTWVTSTKLFILKFTSLVYTYNRERNILLETRKKKGGSLTLIVGSRVRVKSDTHSGNPFVVGKEGEIVEFQEFPTGQNYGVKFDEFVDGHSLERNSAPFGYGWWLSESDLELI